MRTTRKLALIPLALALLLIAGVIREAVADNYPAYDPLRDPLVMDELSAYLLAQSDGDAIVDALFADLVANMPRDAMAIKLAVDQARFEQDDLRRAASRAYQERAWNNLGWRVRAATPISEPSSLWLLIPGGLLIGGGAYLRQRQRRKHRNTTPPIVAREG